MAGGVRSRSNMPHDVQKMVYVGEMPWHRLGVRLPAAAGYEEAGERRLRKRLRQRS